MQTLIYKNNGIILISVLAALSALLIPKLLVIGILGILVLAMAQIYGEKTFVFISIISFLTLTSSLSVELRTAVQVFNILILFYLFFKNYGLDFKTYPKIPKELAILLFFVFLSMFTATFFSYYIFLGIQQIIRLVIFLAIIYFIYSLTKTNADIRLLLFSLITVGIIYSFTLFGELAENNFSFIQLNLSQLEKVSSDYINMNSFGSFFLIIISIVLSFYLSVKENYIKWLLLISLFFLTLSLFITNSRAAILSVAVSSVFIFYNLNKRLLKKMIIAGLLVVPLFFINPISDFIDIYFRLERLSTGRDVIFDVIYNVIKDNIILGVGPAATKYALYPHLDFMLGSPAERFIAFHYNEIEFGHAHNFYLFFWSDLGLLGLFTSILLPVLFFKLCSKAIKKTKNLDTDYYLVSLGITAAGIGLFIRGFFEWGNLISYGTIGIDLPFWILLIILSYINQNKINETDRILFANKRLAYSDGLLK
ncbi:MAG: O-antigen ligase family protein [Ignavibacteriaceae bacterium]